MASERTFGLVPRAELEASSGLDVLSGILEGRLPEPPIGETVDIHPIEVSRGEMLFEGIPSERFYNLMGTIHGGWIATILDTVLGCAVHSTLEPGQSYTTVSLNVQFSKPLTRDTGRVIARGRVTNAGRTHAFAEATLCDARDRVIALGTATLVIVSATRP